MTVWAGKGGQELIPETIEKIKNIKQYLDENNLDLDIEVDGGINEKTAKMVVDSGANILVSGSYILNSDEPRFAISRLKDCL